MKQAVKVTFKADGHTELFACHVGIYEKYASDVLGIGYNALMNARCKNKSGKFENKKVIIEETQLLDIV